MLANAAQVRWGEDHSERANREGELGIGTFGQLGSPREEIWKVWRELSAHSSDSREGDTVEEGRGCLDQRVDAIIG